MIASIRVVVTLTSPTEVQARTFSETKGGGKDQRGKGKEGTCRHSRFSASETPNEDMGRPANQTSCLPVIGLMIPGLQMLVVSVQSLILHGWWQLH